MKSLLFILLLGSLAHADTLICSVKLPGDDVSQTREFELKNEFESRIKVYEDLQFTMTAYASGGELMALFFTDRYQKLTVSTDGRKLTLAPPGERPSIELSCFQSSNP